MNGRSGVSAAAVLAAIGKSLAYLAVFLLSQSIVSVVYVTAITVELMAATGMLELPVVLERLFAHTGEISLISSLLTLAVLAAVFLIRRKNLLRECSVNPVSGRAVGAAAALAPALYLIVTLILGMLPPEVLADYAQASAALEAQNWAVVISTVLLAPLVEEVLFRGLIYSRLARALPPGAAVAGSALLFGLCHGQAVWSAYAFCLGLIFGWITMKTGSILPAMMMHFVFNLVGQLLAAAPAEFGESVWPVVILAVVGIGGCVLARNGLELLFRGRIPEKA